MSVTITHPYYTIYRDEERYYYEKTAMRHIYTKISLLDDDAFYIIDQT